MGTMYETATCSTTCANEHGIAIHTSNKLNVPNPVAVMASSNDAGLEAKNI